MRNITAIACLFVSINSLKFIDGKEMKFGNCEINIEEDQDELDLSGCKLKTVPEDIQDYPSLTRLDLSNNLISSFPKGLKLPNLDALYIDDNPLTEFPVEEDSFPMLNALSLSKTKLKKMPKAVSYFNALEFLYMTDCDLEDIEVMLPKNITHLSLERNEMTTIPKTIYNCEGLHTLKLLNNTLKPLTMTEDQLYFLKNLNGLYLTFKTKNVNSISCSGELEDLPYTDVVDPLTWNIDTVVERGANERVCVVNKDDPSLDNKEPIITGGNSDNNSSKEESVQEVKPRDNKDPGPTAAIITGCLAALVVLAIALIVIKVKKKSKSQSKLPVPANTGEDTPKDQAYSALPKDATSTLTYTATGQSSTSSSCSFLSLTTKLQPFRLEYDEIQDIKTIGSGAFAIVWLVQYRQEFLASKRLHTSRDILHSEQQMSTFAHEIELVSTLRHANIVAFVGVAWTSTEDRLQVLFEYLEGGDLRNCLALRGESVILPHSWTPTNVAIARDIAAALLYVHSFRPPVLHRDLKARNVLLTKDCSTAKLSDFGVSRVLSQEQSMTGCVGTARWLAPEVLNGATKYDETCDIYSFGMILLELETHEIPYHNSIGKNGEPLPEIALMYRRATGELDPMNEFSKNTELKDPEIYNLAKRCLAWEPKDRPNAMVVASELQRILDDKFSRESVFM